ncbi:hypothetical protein [Rhodohalobacter mucosus]|uniref:Outer membrane protein beta-barrel domain-containing protein n=1 Tax=Rhodohalobacter mucosus TaxID=2079485 RepID=A0A316TXJ2_9BACT|nr:hypothetical protein [Rhodohalobacter mucosus]PWN07382.1 hypothetical protein DDZ15_03710 [Rhodohalobacter mucosus]
MKQIIPLLIMILASVQAVAQNNESEPTRKGFVIGLSAGAGYLSIEGDAAPAVYEDGKFSWPNLKIGWMIRSNTAVLLSLPGMAYESEGVDRSFDAIVPSIQHWVLPKWWINGGIGLGLDTVAFYENDHDQDSLNLGTAFMISSGYEIYRKGKFTIDLQGTIQAGRMHTNDTHYDAGMVFAGVGFNFY